LKIEDVLLPEGLAHEIVTAGVEDAAPILFEGAGGECHNMGVGTQLGGLDPPRRLVPVQAGHAHVHPYEGRFEVLPDPQATLAIAGFSHLEAQRFQESAQEQAVFILIVDDEQSRHRFAGGQADDTTGDRAGADLGEWGLDQGNIEAKAGTLPEVRGDADLAAQKEGKALADGQAQAGTAVHARRFG
jgi:hypothetical protein